MVRDKIKAKKSKQTEGLAASKDKSRDMVARTGLGAGAELIDGASKFLAAYGKFITPVVALLIISFGVYYFWNRSSKASEQELRNKIEQAARDPEASALLVVFGIKVRHIEGRWLPEGGTLRFIESWDPRHTGTLRPKDYIYMLPPWED